MDATAPIRLPTLRWRKFSVLPGFGLAMGYTLLYLSLIVLIPLSAVFFKAASLGRDAFWAAITAPRVVAALELSFGGALIGALLNAAFGLLVAWVLVRYRFPGRRIADALVDLPFALPTAVAGIALTTIYAGNGWIGQFLAPLGIKVAFTPLGVIVALTFIGLPFVVRTVQPVLEDLEPELEEAAATLGASRLQTFSRVILPAVWPALLTGFTLAFARGIGEYGSVIFIAGNMPMVSEIAPLLIIIKLEQYDYVGATSIAVAMMVVSFLLLLLINLLQRRSNIGPTAPRHAGPGHADGSTPRGPGEPTPRHFGKPTPCHPGEPTPRHPGEPTPCHPGEPTPRHPGESRGPERAESPLRRASIQSRQCPGRPGSSTRP